MVTNEVTNEVNEEIEVTNEGNSLSK